MDFINKIDDITYYTDEELKQAFDLLGFDAVEHYIIRLKQSLDELDLIKIYNKYIEES